MSRFVVLEHDSPRGLHWDLMLEQAGVLLTWALAGPPDGPGPIAAEALPDHRPAYLDYEGPVSGGRGSVARWDQGTYRVEHRTDDELTALLQGVRLAGRAVLARSADDPDAWRFHFEPR